MKIVNKELIEKFAAKHADAAGALNRWIAQIERSAFSKHSELKAAFPSVDYIGKGRYVFNIKGNDYRLVAVVVFVSGLLTVCFIGAHAEYSRVDCLTVIQ
ncbi:MAG: type II toxin-antitoxin system HigB family toxin [Prevotellaceae bacterium]|jgi:mRNA interferase HigB|nr:type II toxin-antitoxin system HigB family toxin [Prevotellaceae bacterium]